MIPPPVVPTRLGPTSSGRPVGPTTGGGMISVAQAKKIISQEMTPLRKEIRSLGEALGYVLAEDIRAPLSLPIADNSAMDGFVLKAADTRGASFKNPVFLKIKGAIRAGDGGNEPLDARECLRIMTGALVPKGADTVLRKEDARIKDGYLAVSQALSQGNHVRLSGEEIKKGDLVLKKYAIINPGTVGLLASLGKTRVKVFSKPKVSLMTTGNELIRPGSVLKRAQVYESNSWMLRASLDQMGIAPCLVRTLKDKPKVLANGIRQALSVSDVVILTGGVSVGDYDYVKEVLQEQGVRQIFWKISQKPGKPIFFGKKNHKFVFGLPGNPASVFICFYEYVYPLLRRICGLLCPSLAQEVASLEESQSSDSSKFLFLKGKRKRFRNHTRVEILSHQGSHMISSLHAMNAIVLIPPGRGQVKKGESVHVDILPYGEERVV